jgi:glycosyltransferase involved in cell wall biosynthesis
MFTNFYEPSIGGIETSVKSLSRGLCQAGYRTIIFAPEYPESNGIEKEDIFRSKAIRLNWNNILYIMPLPFISNIERAMESLKPDIIHSHQSYPLYFGYEALKFGHKLDIPVVFTYHTRFEDYCRFAPFLPKKISCEIFKWIVVKYCNGCDAIIAPSIAARNLLLFKLKIKKPIYIIPSGVDTNRFNLDSARKVEIRKIYDVDDKELLLITASRLVFEKNIEFLIRAFAIIRNTKENVKLMIIGKGNHYKKLKNLVDTLELGDKVIFTGFVEDEDMAAYYHAGDIFVFASLTETQGLVVLEAMASGLPVVAVKANGIEDTVINGKNGILTENREEDFAKNVIRIIENQNLRNQMAETARIDSQKFSIELWVEKITAIYQAIIEKKDSANKYRQRGTDPSL